MYDTLKNTFKKTSRMFPQDLLWGVLLHLPTKSLMRFKCVSKHWYSIIRDPKFALEHRTIGAGARCLLVNEIRYGPPHKEVILLYMNLKDDHPKLRQHNVRIGGARYKTVTPVVEGLMGWYNDGINEFTLLNVATHELIKLPPSPNNGPAFQYFNISSFTYFLGYDPASQVFKVLNLFCGFGEDLNKISKDAQLTYVFTFGCGGDMIWRKIETRPLDFHFEWERYLCINGALYWMSRVERSLIAFHLSSETFETIAIPQNVSGGFQLANICGRPAFVDVNYNDGMLNVWTIINNDGRGGEAKAWTRKSVQLPSTMKCGLIYAGTNPTGQMMLTKQNSDNFPFHIFLYDHLKNQLIPTELEDEESHEGGCNNRHLLRVHYYEENIIALNRLVSHGEHHQTINKY